MLGGKAPQIAPDFLRLDRDIDVFFRTGNFNLFLPNRPEQSPPSVPGSSANNTSIGSAASITNVSRASQPPTPLEQALTNPASIFTETNDGQLASGTLEGCVVYILFKATSEPYIPFRNLLEY
jgi:hypothetical protein